jgi:hypothetical protein
MPAKYYEKIAAHEQYNNTSEIEQYPQDIMQALEIFDNYVHP